MPKGGMGSNPSTVGSKIMLDSRGLALNTHGRLFLVTGLFISSNYKTEVKEINFYKIFVKNQHWFPSKRGICTRTLTVSTRL